MWFQITKNESNVGNEERKERGENFENLNTLQTKWEMKKFTDPWRFNSFIVDSSQSVVGRYSGCGEFEYESRAALVEGGRLAVSSFSPVAWLEQVARYTTPAPRPENSFIRGPSPLIEFAHLQSSPAWIISPIFRWH